MKLLTIGLMTAIVTILMAASTAQANTYVGNGGNAGDVEWTVTLKQIQMALDAIEKDPPSDEDLCSCNDTYSHSPVCDALNSLTTEQRKFCGATLKTQLSQLKPLVRDTKTVRVDWTRDDIDVLEDGERRAVDAVTDRTQGKVTLHTERFRDLNPSERVFLISHELMHLTSLNNQPLTDEGPQGPFTTANGSRQLVNSMAAAIVIEADEAKAFKRYASTLNRPQGWKMNWIDLSWTNSHVDPRSVFGINEYSGFRARYTHYFTDLGVNAEYATLKGDKQTLTQIHSTEEAKTIRVGASYRLFPFKNPLTYFGQSHFVLSADLDYVRGEFNLRDSSNNDTETSSRFGGSAQISYNFPIALGFWVSISEAYESLPGGYAATPNTAFAAPIDNEKNQFATYFGVSYGF